MVINACRQHLRGACGDVLDTLKGPNYEIIIDDCVKKMKEYITEGRKFDVVFNDLTDIPISTEPQGEHWDFIKKIVTMGLAVLRVNGLFLNHAIGVSCPSALETYEELLKELPFRLSFSKHTAHVPSFMEEYPSLTLGVQLLVCTLKFHSLKGRSRNMELLTANRMCLLLEI
ncbi:hypothetical protein HPB50_022547 [Hyalomma asiaticum]|uniref:Uncharacterized protein n=1 Tax=Hyalomma asiaticum TaxID=266040 RepID=A0ACB7S1K6_HYAAI|nr:hypothetical protein HPB50_022547 [Hyalomma asiaticum]